MSARAPLLIVLAVLAADCAAQAEAESAYVIDKLLVGIHRDKSLDSPIIKVLPTGTELEVLERDGELALVRGPEGEEGWIDAGYLMPEQPAALVVDRLERENRELERRLAEAEARLGRMGEPRGESAAEAAEAGTLERKLASERLRAGELAARISELQGKLQASSAKAARVGELEARIEALQAELEAFGSAAGEGGGAVLAIGRLLLGSKAAVICLLGLLLAAFLGGMFAMDSIQRKRHGGFRL